MARIAVDFDDTLVEIGPDGAYRATDGAVKAMQALRAQGHRIIIHTCRTTIAAENGTLDDEITFIAEVLDSLAIHYDEIYPGPKLVADTYIDDRAHRFDGRWDEVLQHLGRRRS